MSSMRTSSVRRTALDHFEPEALDDPQAQKRLRGQLEQIDYTAFACNREIIAATIGAIDTHKVQRLAVSVAMARAAWVKESLVITEGGQQLTTHQIDKLAQLRKAFEELAEAYEGMRRLIERGYLPYNTLAPR